MNDTSHLHNAAAALRECSINFDSFSHCLDTYIKDEFLYDTILAADTVNKIMAK